MTMLKHRVFAITFASLYPLYDDQGLFKRGRGR